MAGMAARATIASSAASIINFLIFFSSSVERDSSVPHVEQRSNPLMNLGPCLYASAVCAVEHDPKSLLPRALGMGRHYLPSCREGFFSETRGGHPEADRTQRLTCTFGVSNPRGHRGEAFRPRMVQCGHVFRVADAFLRAVERDVRHAARAYSDPWQVGGGARPTRATAPARGAASQRERVGDSSAAST